MGKFRYRVRLETLADVRLFLDIVARNFNEFEVLMLTTASGDYAVNAKSIMGVIYSLEWDNLYLISEKEIYHLFKDFII
jgi:hypothetical protein